ncbi:MAG: hypothetical protein ABIQ72_10105 [Usitatibacter sp.]
MTPQRKTLALLALAVCVSVVAVMMMTQKGSKSSLSFSIDPPANVPSSSRTSSEAVLGIVPGRKRDAPASELKKPVSPLTAEMARRQNYREIHDRLRALPSPTAEETFWLARIIEECARNADRKADAQRFAKVDDATRARFAASLSPKAPNRDRRIAAFNVATRDPCGGLEGLETSDKELRAMHERAAAAGDPKSRAWLLEADFEAARRNEKGEADWGRAVKVSDAQIDALQRIMASGDPRALVDVVGILNSGIDVHLRAPDESPIDGGSLYYAATLAACEMGYPCGSDSRPVASGCALQGNCDAADYRDYVFFYALAPGDTQRVMRYQAEFMRALRENDWSFFSFQRGPAPTTAAFQKPSP